MSRNFCMVLAASLALAGCDLADKQEVLNDDSSNPYYKQAQQDLDNNNPAAAASDYEAALRVNSKLAGAHLELGHIYGEKLNDPISSIFHFQEYLKLDPTGDKADEVKALIDKQSQAFAAGLPNSPTQSADDYAKLQADNASLKKQVDDAARTIAKLQSQLGKHHHDMAPAPVVAAVPASPAAVPDATATTTDTNAPSAAPAPAVAATPADVTTPPPSTNAVVASAPPRALPLDATNAISSVAEPGAAADGPSRTYKVVKGDSLWKIAHKMYPGDTKNGVDKIQEANKDAIGGKPLKIGQVLIIPQ